MRARDRVKYGVVGAATLVVASAILLTTGWGQAAAATVTQVFVTNKGAAQAVPVHEQGTVGTFPNLSAAAELNFFVQSSNTNNDASNVGELIHPTQASIDLTSLTVALDPFHNADPWQVIFYIVTVPTGRRLGIACRPGQPSQLCKSSPCNRARLRPCHQLRPWRCCPLLLKHGA